MTRTAQADHDGSPAENIDLEISFPEASEVFKPYAMQALTDETVLVMLDTSVLLLPYETSQDDLAEIGTIYRKLAAAGRLYIAARAAREFAKLRDRKLTEMVKTIGEIKSRLPSIGRRLSPLLDGLPGHADLVAAHDSLMKAKTSYAKALEPLVKTVRDWRGNDPVSHIYSELFSTERVIELEEQKSDLLSEWNSRLASGRPPGLKDSRKPDGGIGDFLIWKSALKLGKTEQRDLVLVTNETKPDWFVRSNGEHLYPRLELIDEYRRHSGGKKIRFCSLHQLLGELNANERVVEEVRTAEASASNFGVDTIVVARSNFPNVIMFGEVNFDFMADNGRYEIYYGDNSSFSVRFIKRDNDLYLVQDASGARIAHIRYPQIGGIVHFNQLDSSSSSLRIQAGSGFAILNPDGYLLAGRVLNTNNHPLFSEGDNIAFAYSVSEPGGPGQMQ